MAIKFLNIKTKRVLVADSGPKIAALYNSSDRSPNVNQGQDFGWRLAPEVVVEMEDIKKDVMMLQRIAAVLKMPYEDVDEKAILTYISSKTVAENAPVAEDSDYSDEYYDSIRKERAKRAKAKMAGTISEDGTLDDVDVDDFGPDDDLGTDDLEPPKTPKPTAKKK